MPDWSALIAANNDRWGNAQFHPHALETAKGVAQRLVSDKAKAVYKHIEAITGVPWYFVALVHEREASQSWKANIANGDPWSRVTVHVPKGRGPFTSFVTAAVDALRNCPPYAARWKDWSIGGLLTILELYNGVGYEKYHHMASPYLWSGTDQYARGKYVSDGHFDPSAVDSQLGCAVLLKAMIIADPTVGDAVNPPEPPEPDEPPPVDENGPPEIDPNTFPGGSEAPPPVPEEPPSLPTGNNAPAPRQVPPWMRNSIPKETSVVKSVLKSKISWILGILGISNASQLIENDNAFQILQQVVQQPRFIILALTIALVAMGWYFYWRDHGRGSV